MAKRELTDEQKQALRDRLAKARAAKQAKTNTSEKKSNTVYGIPTATISQTQYDELIQQIEELKTGQFAKLLEAVQQGRTDGASLEAPQVQGGQMVGSIEKWSTDLDQYPNPTSRLIVEPRLQRFAFAINYELIWEAQVTRYQTIDKTWYKEPRFYIQLLRRLVDDDTGDFTGEKIVVARLFMHEDMEAGVAAARTEGIDVEADIAAREDLDGIALDPSRSQKLLMDELRYIRVRDWLLECFMPKPAQTTKTREKVMGGKLVQLFEAAVDKGQTAKIDWDKVQKMRG